MATVTRNFISLTALLFLVVGTFATIMVIFSDKQIVSGLEHIEYYKIGGALANAILIMFLIYLTTTAVDKSLTYKTIIIFILIVGLVVEIVMVNVKVNIDYEEYTKYAVIVFNFLFRAYHLIGYIQEPWAELTLQSVNKAVKTVTAPITTSSAPAATEDPKKTLFNTKWNEVKNNARNKYPGDVDFTAAETVKQQAVASGEFTTAKLNEAAAALKKKSDGSALAGIDVPSVGGRRRR